MAFRKGDKICLKNRKEITGVVKDVKPITLWGADGNEYLVEYDNKDLIPPEDWHTEDQIMLIATFESSSAPSTCDCGASFDRHFPDNHSRWCSINKV